MFGRRIIPPRPPAAPPPPPPWGGLPIVPMHRAFDDVIRRLSQALAHFGIDCGALGDPTPVTGDPRTALGNSLCFVRGGETRFLTFYSTRDFEKFAVLPHWYLFLMTSALGFAEDVMRPSFDRTTGERIARGQFVPSLLDAHLAKAWIDMILPSIRVAKAHDEEAMRMMHRTMIDQGIAIGNRVPLALLSREDVRRRVEDWCTDWPAVFSNPLTPQTRRINNLPMDERADTAITQHLAQLQANALKAQLDRRSGSSDHPA